MRTYHFIFVLIFLLAPIAIYANIVPADNAKLNYRLIGFSFLQQENATAYRLEIYEDGNIQSKPLLIKEQKDNKIIATVPAFGKKYSWRVKYLNKKKVIATSELYHFSVNENPHLGENRARIVVLSSAPKYKDMLFFFDNTKTLCNMQGEVLWFLPVIPGITDSSVGMIRDIKLTDDGTITFLTKKNVYEIDYDANILWSAHKDDSIYTDSVEQFHHEFTKLSNNNYMTIGNINVLANSTKQPQVRNDTAKNVTPKTMCGMILEYNPQRQIVWKWNSCNYVDAVDAVSHFNSFYFDEKKRVVYSSYRNLNRVLKVAYPSGKILAQYGEDARQSGSLKGTGMFYYQHNCGVNSDGDLMLFNNNYKAHLPAPQRNSESIASVTVFKEPVTESDNLEVLWEFKIDFDSLASPVSAGGGSVCELDKGDYLVCTGIPGRNFIVSKEKKVLWNVLTERYEGGWKSMDGYRASPVRPAALPQLLFR